MEIGQATHDQKESLGDLIFDINDEFAIECQLKKDWPSGRAVFFNEDKSFIIKVNREDHLEIQYLEKKKDIESFFEKLARISSKLDHKLDFAHEDKLGFVTTLPQNLGTTLRA